MNWSGVNSEKATKTKSLLMNRRRSYQKQGKVAEILRQFETLLSAVIFNAVWRKFK